MGKYEVDPKDFVSFVRTAKTDVNWATVKYALLFETPTVGQAVIQSEVNLVDAVRLGASLRDGKTAMHAKDVGCQYIGRVISILYLTPQREPEYRFVSGELLNCWVEDDIHFFNVFHTSSHAGSKQTIRLKAEDAVVIHVPVADIAQALSGGAL